MESKENGKLMASETSEKEKIKVLTADRFGLCPRCGTRLVLFKNTVSAYSITESAWINKSLAEMVISVYSSSSSIRASLSCFCCVIKVK